MWTGHAAKTAILLAATGLVTGCAQTTGTYGPRRTAVGSLKASVSHLEFENEQLRRELAQQKTQNRDIEDQLVQVESDNGDLTARLDDARHLLSQKGLDVGGESSTASRRDLDRGGSATTLPAGQSSRKRRKAPFTQIPGRIEMSPSSDPADDEHIQAPKPGLRDEFGPQGLLEDPDRWLPIARGTSNPSSKGKTPGTLR